MILLIKGLLWILSWIKKKTTEGKEWKKGDQSGETIAISK